MSTALEAPVRLTSDLPTLDEPPETLYEVVQGRIVEEPPMSAYSAWIANILIRQLARHDAQALGRAVSEVLFDMNPPDHPQRRPDVAFVSYERWPRRRRVPRDAAWRVVPELAVEVVSPSNSAEHVLNKVYEYFDAGVRVVWVIFPSPQVVHVYHSRTQIQVVSGDEPLEGGLVLPGFRITLGTLFETEADTD